MEMLDYANKNDIIWISMPNHPSHHLQPLDRSVFKSLLTHFYEHCRPWLKQNLSFGNLLNKAWEKAVSAENVISGKAPGVYPFNPAETSILFKNQEVSRLIGTPITRAILHLTSTVEDNTNDDDEEFISASFNEPRRDTNYSTKIIPRKSKSSSLENVLHKNISKRRT